jgi:DNA-binding MltR family transcriptional regulator
MPWALKSKTELDEIEDLAGGNGDRMIAIVGATLVDDRLGLAIRSRMRRDKTVAKRLFGVSRPLGTFSTKIDLGYMLGIYSKQGFRELNIVREVRNEFAHQIRSLDFSAETVRKKCMDLHAVEDALNKISSVVSDHSFYNYREELKLPRTRFALTIRFIFDHLELLSMMDVTPGVHIF